MPSGGRNRRFPQFAAPGIRAGVPGKWNDGRRVEIGKQAGEETLRKALENEHFVLFCQPIVELASSRVTQHEVLLRLQDADAGEHLTPAHFLAAAEEYGMMR